MKKSLKKFFIMPGPWSYVIFSFSMLFVSIVLKREVQGWVAYLSYGISFYGLIIFCIAIFRDAPRVWHSIENSKIVNKMKALPVVGRFLTDDIFRIRISLYVGTAINILYVCLKMAVGVWYHSLWLLAYATYYIALIVLRGLIIENNRRNADGKLDAIHTYRRYRACGIALLFLNIVLAGITQIAVKDKVELDYPGVLVYGMALYTFYAFFVAFAGVVRYRTHERVMVSAVKVTNFSAALMSMLALEIVMTNRFGAGEHAFQRMMTLVLGGISNVIIFFMAIRMILKANRLIRIEKNCI